MGGVFSQSMAKMDGEVGQVLFNNATVDVTT
jgi:hypothetical protein